MRFNSSILLICSAGLTLFGCATVPSDAPRELHEADSALESAKQQDGKTYMPLTHDRAEEALDKSVSLFKASKRANSDEAKQSDLNAAIAKANESKALSTNILNVTSDVKAWDNDITQYVAMKEGNLPTDVAQTETTTEVAILPEVALPVSVAYFKTAESELSERDQQNLQALANALKEHRDLAVNLVGFADYRGSENFNLTLSEQRAQTVSDALVNLGVSRDQIKMTAAGEGRAEQTRDAAGLQLDRRVDVMFVESGVAH